MKTLKAFLKESKFSQDQKQKIKGNFVGIKVDRYDRMFICTRPAPLDVIKKIMPKIHNDGLELDIRGAWDVLNAMENGREGQTYINPFGELFFMPYNPKEYTNPTYYK